MLGYIGAGTLLYHVDKLGKIKVFLCKRANNPEKDKWSIISGGWNKKDGNNLKKTASRELREETGWVLDSTKKYKSIWSIDLFFFKFKVYALKAKYIMYPKFKSHEFLDMHWFDIDNLPDNCERFVKSQISSLKDLMLKNV